MIVLNLVQSQRNETEGLCLYREQRIKAIISTSKEEKLICYSTLSLSCDELKTLDVTYWYQGMKSNLR